MADKMSRLMGEILLYAEIAYLFLASFIASSGVAGEVPHGSEPAATLSDTWGPFQVFVFHFTNSRQGIGGS